MVRWTPKRRYGPVGVDLGNRSVKLVQFSADRSRIIDAVRWDLPATSSGTRSPKELAEELPVALKHALDGRAFKGREAVVCLTDRDLFLQNIRVPKGDRDGLETHVRQEAAGKLPYSIADAEIRFIEAGDVRQGDTFKREIILLAAPKDAIELNLQAVVQAGLRPVALDVEPLAFLRGYAAQLRRDEDLELQTVYVHVGYGKTAIAIAAADNVRFVKYLDVGGMQMDAALAQHLKMDLPNAIALRRHNGDRRENQKDPEIARSVAEAVRPVVEQLARELSLCIRYHSVTFRGLPLDRLALGGGEATAALQEALSKRLGIASELGNPFRAYPDAPAALRQGQWDVAAGLALWNFE